METDISNLAPNELAKYEQVDQPMDHQETKLIKAKTKLKAAGLNDIRLFSMQKDHDKYLTPAASVIARGFKIKIKDLQDEDPEELKANQAVKFTNYEVGVQGDK